MKECYQKLLNAKNWQEATNVLETVHAGPGVKKLVETAFAVKETQPHYAEQFMTSAIKEMEDDEKNHKSPDLPKNGSQEKPTSELNPSPDSEGDAEGSSSVDGTKKEGSDAPNSDIESMQTASGEDQMKEMGGMPPLAPPLQQGMMNNAMNGKGMPPGYPTVPQMQQMQYMINETVKGWKKQFQSALQEIQKLKAANVALDGKLKETMSKNPTMFGPKSMSLDMRPVGQKTQETERMDTNMGPVNVPKKTWNRAAIQETRQKVSEIDRMFKEGKLKPDGQMYG